MRTCPVCQSKQENEKPFCMECGAEHYQDFQR